jgi:uncharacterized membrane protein
MGKIVLFALLVVVSVPLIVLGLLSVYNPRLLSAAVDPRRWHRHRFDGPRATGRPIQEVAADLRRVLVEHDRIVQTKSQWYVVHDLRVCERELHDLAEEAAAELGLAPCRAGVGGWTTVHLGVRLGQLTEEGLALPRYVSPNA